MNGWCDASEITFSVVNSANVVICKLQGHKLDKRVVDTDSAIYDLTT